MRHARQYHEFVKNHGYKRWIEKINFQRGYNIKIPWDVTRGTVRAHIHRDSWVVDCPHCLGAMIVDDKEPIFWCVDCHNAGNDGFPYKVDFPHQAEVEALMAMRKNPQTRNWYPGETIVDLIEEQIEHGEYNGIHS